MKLSIGAEAPNFKLPDVNKEFVSLSDFKGRTVILFFFPMAWTGVCTKEMCTVEEDYKQYQSLGAEVIGISVDSIFALKRFAEDNKLTQLKLLSDFNKEAINSYGVVHHDFAFGYKDVAQRATFVIDAEGKIAFIDNTPTLGDMPDMASIKAAVQKLK
ncbi:MAG: hypothetical protein RIQ89_1964 [Bacteroidota bacterium]|jgi:glutaredoxin-dependent peroxiredoxin